MKNINKTIISMKKAVVLMALLAALPGIAAEVNSSKEGQAHKAIIFLNREARLPVQLIDIILALANSSQILDIQKDAHTTLDAFAKERCYEGRSISWLRNEITLDQFKKNLRFPICCLAIDKCRIKKLPLLTISLFNQREQGLPSYAGSTKCLMVYELDESNNQFILGSKSANSYPLGTASIYVSIKGNPFILKGDTSLELPITAPRTEYNGDGHHITARVIDHDPKIGGTQVEVCFDDGSIKLLQQELTTLKSKKNQKENPTASAGQGPGRSHAALGAGAGV